MNEELLSKLSDEQKALINNEMLIAKVLEIRNPPESSPPVPVKAGWQKFLESSGGTALITVVIGGIMGGLITATFQFYAKQREMELAAYQQKLEKRQETMKSAYDLIGLSSAPADNLIRYKLMPGNDTTLYTDKEKKAAKEREWAGILEKLEDAQQKWSAEEKKAILSLSHYYSNNTEVKNAWKELNKTLPAYFVCAKRCASNSTEVCKSCDQQRKALGENIEFLGCTVEKASKDTDNSQITCEKSNSDSTPK
jgi:hypothetical protein